MHRHLKRNLAIGTTALAAAAFTGGAYAATQDSPSKVRQAFLTDVAKRLNVTPQQLTAALKAASIDQLNAAVKAGKLTQAQANAIKQRIEQGGAGPFLFAPRPLTGLPPLGALPGTPPKGLPGIPPKGSPGSPPARLLPAPRPGALPLPLFGPGGRSPLGAAAKYLGLTDAQLFAQLRDGKTLAKIAQSRGKSVAGLKRAMFGAEKARLDQAVKDKLITPAQEKQALSRLNSRLSAKLQRSFRPLPLLGGRRWGKVPGGPAGPGGRVLPLTPP